MAKRKQRRAVVDKWKKKKEYTLIAPKMIGSQEVGHTVADKDEKVIGRVVKVNLGTLLNQFKKKKYYITFKVNSVQGSNAYTEILSLELKKGFIRRLVSRRSNKLEEVQYLKTKDSKKVKIKTMCVTRRKVEKPKERDIARKVRSYMRSFVKDNNIEDIFDSVISKEIGKEISNKVKNIALIRACMVLEIKDVTDRKE